MIVFKGTIGEWKFDESSVYSESNDVFIEGNVVCLAPEGLESSMKKWKQNSKIISLAPEMFDMLRRLELLQSENYGNGMATHMALIEFASEVKKLIKKTN